MSYCSAAWNLSVSSVVDTAWGPWASLTPAKGAVTTPTFSDNVVFSDETSFIHEGVCCVHTIHMCALMTTCMVREDIYATSVCHKCVNWNHWRLFVEVLLVTVVIGQSEIPNLSWDSVTNFSGCCSSAYPLGYMVSTWLYCSLWPNCCAWLL